MKDIIKIFIIITSPIILILFFILLPFNNIIDFYSNKLKEYTNEYITKHYKKGEK